MSNKEGYCWASNQHFVELFGKDERSIQRGLQELESKRLIRRDTADKRRIYVTQKGTTFLSGGDKSVRLRGDKNDGGGMTNLSPLLLENQIRYISPNTEVLGGGVAQKQPASPPLKESELRQRCPLGQNGEHKSGCINLLDRIAQEKGLTTWPTYPKQINWLHKGIRAGFSLEDVEDMAARMIEKGYWQERGWDVSDVITQLSKGGKRA